MSSSLIPLSRVVMDTSVLRLGPGSVCRITRMPLQDGAELVYWRSALREAIDLPLQDDSDYVHFSFNSRMDGRAACHFDGWEGGREFAVREGTGTISYGPGRRGHYCQEGCLDNVTVMVRPDVLQRWSHDLEGDLASGLASAACFLHGHGGAELRGTAHQLAQGLAGEGAASRHGLWLQAQSLLLVGLFLESCGRPRAALPVAMQRRMARVHEHLLADLSRAPSLEALAREAGVSVPTLARAFRRHYGRSIYDCFQHERMQQARTELLRGRLSVAHVAADLGYSNPSHFSAAFRKQFGVNPSALRRGG